MRLKYIYRPIEKELKNMEKFLEISLNKSKNRSILRINNFLLGSHGKRIRPALMILSAKAVSNDQDPAINHQLIKIASAIELIHAASLIHDDVIDSSYIRHSRPTVNSKWGEDVAIALGDYLYSEAFELISCCGNMDIIRCISSATKSMCEGELLQVCERDNLDLLRERYMVIIKKKTASLFAASCEAGGLISRSGHLNPVRNIDSEGGGEISNGVKKALREYGLNFGIAFQIVDDYLDIVAEEQKLGKAPGQDIGVGEMTLPLLNLLESADQGEREELKALFAAKEGKERLPRIRSKLLKSRAGIKTKELTSSYMGLAKQNLDILSPSPYKESLIRLADFIMERGFS